MSPMSCSRVKTASGVPPGSHHSPQWKPVSQRKVSCGAGSGRAATREAWRPLAARVAAKSTHAVIESKLSARRSRSPYSTQVSQGTMTAASPQPAEPVMKAAMSLSWVAGPWGSGRMLGTRPSGHWSARRSRSHLAENPATS